ncbi:MAG: hypothetical protein ACJA0T_002201 [Colwellia sp.]|jgi:hypothetical protein
MYNLALIFVSFVRRFIQVIAICCLLTACLSTPVIINTEPVTKQTAIYQYNQALWQKTALNSDSLFQRYGLKIFAAITWQQRSKAETYQFTKLQIAKEADQYSINLLHPDFTQKMACGWYCEYLDQPISQTALSPYTMLDKTFEGNKTQLYNFYDELARLEQNLQSLSPERLAAMPEIITQLVNTQQSFDSLDQVIVFINNFFDEIDFQQLATLKTAPGIISPLPDSYQTKTILTDNLLPNIDDNLIASFSPETSLETMLNLHKNRQEQDISTELTTDKLWSKQNKLPINKGQFVCSFQDNYFGEITAVSGDKVTLALKGQVKQLIDGLMMDAPIGSLFSSNTQITYLANDGQLNFTRSQIAPCTLKIS